MTATDQLNINNAGKAMLLCYGLSSHNTRDSLHRKSRREGVMAVFKTSCLSVARRAKQRKHACTTANKSAVHLVRWPHIMRNINQVRAPVKSSAPHHCSTSASTSSKAAVATVAAARRVELPADRDRDQLLHHVVITGRIIIIVVCFLSLIHI